MSVCLRCQFMVTPASTKAENTMAKSVPTLAHQCIAWGVGATRLPLREEQVAQQTV
eukprot:CAMPEP_0179206146 /NCGR_PEP_ID=MMETSP0796-20121207/102786_1 /TAXON_ID=73915 /ORGANISM="Pyrodinium bahamense, Strain pbaha01" /LENGTH=55 /DNA_ID=CAMNT_0020911061 /DNA_START=33 /DNA_END=200 /DNA_ORIENTATION=+